MNCFNPHYLPKWLPQRSPGRNLRIRFPIQEVSGDSQTIAIALLFPSLRSTSIIHMLGHSPVTLSQLLSFIPLGTGLPQNMKSTSFSTVSSINSKAYVLLKYSALFWNKHTTNPASPKPYLLGFVTLLASFSYQERWHFLPKKWLFAFEQFYSVAVAWI